MNQCSPSQFILSEKRVHVTHTLTRLMLQKTFLPWCSAPRNEPSHYQREKEKKRKFAPDEQLHPRKVAAV
jgi:hypothetical protein